MLLKKLFLVLTFLPNSIESNYQLDFSLFCKIQLKGLNNVNLKLIIEI